MLVAQYIVEFIKLFIVTSYISKTHKTENIRKPNLISVLFFFIIDTYKLIYYQRIVEHSYDTYLCGILAIFVIFCGFRSLKRLSFLFGIYILICFIDMLVVGFLMTSFSLDISIVLVNPIYKTMMNSVTIILYLAIGYIIRLFNLNFHLEFMSRKEICLFIIGIAGCGFYIAPYQLYVNNSNNSSGRKSLILVISIVGIIIVAVALMLLLQNNNLKHLKESQKLQEELLSAQQSYYVGRLQQEQEIRKFRHDINEHLYCISYLINSSKHQELQSYVAGLNDTFSKINQKSGLQTGSELITIVLSDLMNQYSDQQIQVKWHNQIPTTNIDNRDLCGLFSNLLKNSFEATNKCQEKIIDVDTQQQGNAFFIKISNTCICPVKILGDTLLSTKSNPVNHGFGSQIIRDTVNKYNGEIKYFNKNNFFSVEITFLNICKNQ